MATKKKEIVPDPKMAALFAAISSGDTTSLNQDEKQQLQEMLATLGLKAVAKGMAEAKYSRTEKRRQWMTAAELSEDEVQTVKNLPEKIGKAPIVTEDAPRALTQDEIDLWMDETLVEREAEDILKGRHEARRATFFNVATFQNGDDPFATGTFASPKHGHKFTVTKQERGGTPDYSKLEELLDAKTWKAVSEEVTTREVNEDKLGEAIATGKIPLEVLQQVVTDKTVVRVLRVDRIKEGDEV